MGDRYDRLLQSDTKRRPPVPFNPWRPEASRPPRGTDPTKWGTTSYIDRVGDRATGRVDRERKKEKNHERA